MPTKKAKIGTEGTCRHCEATVLYGNPDPDVPFYVQWFHPLRKLPDGVRLRDLIFCEEEKPDGKEDWLNNRTTAEPREWCLEQKADYSGLCLSPVGDNDLFMCGIHAKKEYERLEGLEASSERKGIQQTLRDFVDPTVAHLNNYYELEARPERENQRYYGDYTGYIVVNPAKLVELVRRIEEETDDDEEFEEFV